MILSIGYLAALTTTIWQPSKLAVPQGQNCSAPSSPTHRDLAMFNMAIDSKLRGCDLVKMKVIDVMASGPRSRNGWKMS